MIGPELDMVYPSNWAGGIPFAAGDVHEANAVGHPKGSVFKFVRNDSGTGDPAAVKGNVVYYKGADGYANATITTDRTDGVLGAGVLLGAIPVGGHGWIQTDGATTLNQDLENSPGDGDALALSATDGKLTLWDNSGTGDTPIVATAIDASAKKVALNFVR